MSLNFEDLGSAKPEINIQDIYNSCVVDLSEVLVHPEILLSIGRHLYKGEWYDTPIMTEGEFSAITAVSKAKKSFLKSAFLGCYVNDEKGLFPNIKTHRQKDYTILDFDTEQGKYYTQRTLRRVHEICGIRYDNYHGYATRHLTSSERLAMVDYCLKNQETLYKEKVKLVSIDGVADLVDNTNDIVMSKEAADYMQKWTYDYNIHITTVIHKSAQTNKPLGHLGTYVLKKAETVIDLVVKDDVVEVSNPYSRGYKFDTFSFSINGDALPYLVDEF